MKKQQFTVQKISGNNLKSACMRSYTLYTVHIAAITLQTGDESMNSVKTETSKLKSALQTIDVRVLDHVVTGGGRAESLAERGLI
jgi:phosphoribosyl-dephospho-CoA transferase